MSRESERMTDKEKVKLRKETVYFSQQVLGGPCKSDSFRVQVCRRALGYVIIHEFARIQLQPNQLIREVCMCVCLCVWCVSRWDLKRSNVFLEVLSSRRQRALYYYSISWNPNTCNIFHPANIFHDIFPHCSLSRTCNIFLIIRRLVLAQYLVQIGQITVFEG